MGVIAYQLLTTGLVPNTTGLGKNLAQQLPVPIYIETNDTLATVLVTGYLNKSRTDFQIPYNNQQMALVYTTDQGSVWLAVQVSGTNYSLQGTTNVSTVYEAAVGSAAAPSYTFVGRTDVGLYSGAAHELDMAVSGAKVAAITSAGLAVTGLISATTTIAAGTNVTAGSSGTAGTYTSFPTTASRGTFVIAAANDTGNKATTLSNGVMGQNTVFTLPDPGAATSNVGVTTAATVNNNLIKATGTAGQFADAGIVAANVVVNSAAGAITLPNAVNSTSYGLVVVNITVGQAALAAGGSVTLLASSTTKQYQIVAMYLNSGGTNFSGGGGDRLGQVTDGTTVYSVIPAATMQSLVNAQWGITALPLPASAAVSTKTAAGAPLTFKYSGGTTDYTAGSLVITVIAIQTA